MNTQTPKNQRQPVVVIMGHIDHGKSTLLDYIRKANTTETEAGGITQHVAAYEAAGITFLDTPGHAAFTSIRERGSRTADIAVLIVSGEDGVKPQTVEAISWIKKANIPCIVAVNKIDKPNSNPDKVKGELAEHDILVEGWGGTIPIVLISAKTGQGVPDLLEMLKLQAEIDDLSYDGAKKATGFVIESKRDGKRGVSATLILKDGVLKKGEYLRSGGALTPVRVIEETTGGQIEKAEAGKPVVIIGWSEVPPVGSEFFAYDSKKDAERTIEIPKPISSESVKSEDSRKLVPVVIKADTVGSLEAIVHESKKLETEKIGLKVVTYGVGPVSEADVKLGKAFPELLIIGFNVKIESNANDMIVRDQLSAKTFSIIYELIEWLGEIMEERTPKEEVDEITGIAKILKIFSVSKYKQVVGGRVDEGAVEVNSRVNILRRDIEIGEGHIRELQSKKQKTSSVEAGTEFGAMIESKMEIAAGDKIVCVKRVVK